jgi:hypothetical protein
MEDIGSMNLEHSRVDQMASCRCRWYTSVRSRGSLWTSQRMRAERCESDELTEMGLGEQEDCMLT